MLEMSMSILFSIPILISKLGSIERLKKSCKIVTHGNILMFGSIRTIVWKKSMRNELKCKNRGQKKILFIVNFLVYQKFEKTFFVKVKNLEIFVWNNDKSSLKCIEKNKNN